MATKPPMTDGEAAAEMNRLMDELCPDRAEHNAVRPKGRTAEESLAILKTREERLGPAEAVDEDFAGDVEEGRRLFRSELKDLWD